MGVSGSTVSRALNDHYSIGKKTIKAIKKLASERGYSINNIAASLRKQQTNNIGVLVPRINRPFISSLISGMEEAAQEAGYNVLISQSHDNSQREIENINAFFDSRVCGLIVSLAMETKQYDHFERFLKNNTPVVFVDRIPGEFEGYKVAINNFNSGFKATRHLIEQGCRRIALFGGARNQTIYAERKRGYLAALQEAGLPVDESIILEGNILSADEGAKWTAYLLGLQNPPDGIFSTNDTAAVSAIQYAKSVGVRIPDELAVIGFNNDPLCLIVDPPLSSVTHPAMDMGKLAVEQIIRIMESAEPVPVQTITLETEVIARASSLRNRQRTATGTTHESS